MSLGNSTEVLVVGAGPVGMTLGLLLAEHGVGVTVIDAKNGPAARSYACALHPHSLELFGRLGLLPELLSLGRRIGVIAFYDGMVRRAEVRLADLPAKHPYLLVLPQNALEQLLERALSRRAGAGVHWHHRFADFQTDARGVVATVEKLGGTASGYIVPHWELVVKATAEVRAAFLIGADGHNSLVRRRLGANYEAAGEAEMFAVFEFDAVNGTGNEIRVTFDENTTNVLWPLPGGRYRWSFQETRAVPGEEFPNKERRAVWIEDPQRNRQLDQRLHDFLQRRAPWFAANVSGFDWVSRVQFERCLVDRFGQDPCWLVGDAAHQTGPVGVQSFNVGLREAEGLADFLKARLHNEATVEDLELWQRRWREEWQRLLGLQGGLRASDRTDPWVRQHAGKILACLPASGDDLARCARQLELDYP